MTNREPDLPLACRMIIAKIQWLLANRPLPILVVIDGGSGAGKSTLSAMIAQRLDAALVPNDDFFAAHIPNAEWGTRTIPERVRDVINSPRLRAEVLEPLLAGQPARWQAFDFEAGLHSDRTYGMCTDYKVCAPKQATT